MDSPKISESVSRELEFQTEIQTLQHQLEELRTKYDTELQSLTVMELEKEEFHKELQRIKQENTDLTEKNMELNQMRHTMEMERHHYFKPQMQELLSKHVQETEMKSQLTMQTQNISKLNSENTQIKEENEKYKLGLQKYDTKFRKKEEISTNIIKSLRSQLSLSKQENEVLNKKLWKCELDLYQIRKQTKAFAQSDEEKVYNQIQGSLLNQENIEIILEDMDECSEDSMPSISEEEASPHSTSAKPLIISNLESSPAPAMGAIRSHIHKTRKTSITLKFRDLASVMESTDTQYALRSKLWDLHRRSSSDLGLGTGQLYGLIEEEIMGEFGGASVDTKTSEITENDLVCDKLDRNEEFEKLKMENEKLMGDRKDLEAKLERREKKIESLKDKNASLQMTLSKKSCNMVPWCR